LRTYHDAIQSKKAFLHDSRISSRRFGKTMLNTELKQKIIGVCGAKIAQKGSNVGLSFYAFFAKKNDDPVALMDAATWWITTHRLNHFETATKIKKLVEAGY
jgi:Family of unknown function (DUF6500)